MMELVWHRDNIAIGQITTAFGTGFSVYRIGLPDEGGMVTGTKLNNPNGWFGTLKAAIAFAEPLA